MYIFGFDPTVAATNIVGLMKYVVLAAGICAMIGFLFKGKLGMAIGSILATAFIYCVLANGTMANLGQDVSSLLTINNVGTTQSTTATSTTTTQSAAQSTTATQ